VIGPGTAQSVSARWSLSPRGWLVWLTLVACLPPLGLNLVIPLDRALAAGLGLGSAERMASIGLYALGLAAGQPLAGVAADLWGRRPTVVAGLAIGCAGGLLSCLAAEAASLLAGRALTGLGLSVALVVPRAVLRDLVNGPTLQRGMATISGAFALTPAIAPILGWWLLDFTGWRGVLGLLPCLIAVTLLAALLMQSETRPAATVRPGSDSLLALWKHRPSRWIALAFAAIGSLFFVMIAVVPAALRDTISAGDRGVALLIGGTYLGFLAGNLIVAATSRRRDSLLLCGWGVALAASGIGLMALCIVVPSGPLWASALFAYSLGHGLIFPAALGRIMQAMPARAGMAAAVAGMMPMLAGAGLCLLAALVTAAPTVRLVLVATPMILLGALALLAARRESAR
jgi:predicted MFS family arabinose efflux permease